MLAVDKIIMYPQSLSGALMLGISEITLRSKFIYSVISPFNKQRFLGGPLIFESNNRRQTVIAVCHYLINPATNVRNSYYVQLTVFLKSTTAVDGNNFSAAVKYRIKILFRVIVEAHRPMTYHYIFFKTIVFVLDISFNVVEIPSFPIPLCFHPPNGISAAR